MENNFHPNWKILSSGSLKWKIFVQATGEETKKDQEKESTQFTTSFSGKEVKDFYEGLVGENCSNEILSHTNPSTSFVENQTNELSSYTGPSTSKLISVQKYRESHEIDIDQRHLLKVFSYAQNNETAALQDLLDKGIDVNLLDEHGWSLLMIAACAGSLEAVTLLLKHSANIDICDAKNNTAISLATINGHKKIIDLISNYSNNFIDVDNIKHEVSELESIEEFYCESCKKIVKESTQLQHETSITHQFNTAPLINKTVYGISPSNKGYQLLVNQGWDTEKGLGPENKGTKFPVKTVIKRNREGLGNASHKEKARITHFGPGDTSAVKTGARTIRPKILSRREKKKEKLKEKRKETDIRRILNEPDYPN